MPISASHMPLEGVEHFMLSHFPLKPLQALYGDSERVRKHPIYGSGNSTTHLLGADGSLIECRANSAAELTDLLNSRGFQVQPPPVLTKRSEFRTPWKPTSASKEERKILNGAHVEYQAGSVDLPEYMDRIRAFLDAHTDQENVTAFMSEHFEAMVDRSFGPKDKKSFSHFLTTAWNDYRKEHGLIKVTFQAPDNDEGQLLAVEGTNRLAGLQKATLRANLEECWHKMMLAAEGADQEFAIDELLTAALGVARPVVQNQMADLRECATTVEDAISETVVAFWKLLKDGKIHGAPYSLLRNIAHRKATDAYNGNLEQSKIEQPLEIEDKDDSQFTTDNPLLRPDRRPQFVRELPKEFVGKDRMICNYIREGLTYKEIGTNLELTEGAVKARVGRMKGWVEAGQPQ